ncbi:hypothetical protein CA12_03140 [Alienimonas californiensis]|uniref:Uncharacterized protein n=1 Tax=Alienimonas californiensis TaxID=2527989 RepID=A0A517P4G0_9PLAN|nr:hypothetical protein CA12_03140 [Alienimonas californiensis]
MFGNARGDGLKQVPLQTRRPALHELAGAAVHRQSVVEAPRAASGGGVVRLGLIGSATAYETCVPS